MKLNWGTYILIFILLFLSLCTIFIIFSLRQDHDLVTPDYYREGANFTSGMEIRERSAPYADSILFVQDDSPRVVITPDMAKQADNLEIWFYRPSSQEDDLRILPDRISDTIPVDPASLTRGRYLLKVSWTRDSARFSVSKEIFVNNR